MLTLARGGEPEGRWLRAERQTGGKGRLGRSWQSQPGNLHASTFVRLQDGDPPPASLALVAAVALHETVQACAGGQAVQIKWPNDLVCAGAKLAGILLERTGDAVVLGFGVNLAAFPLGLVPPATSLAALTGVAPDPDEFLARLATQFAHWLARWRGEGLALVVEQWLARAHELGRRLAVGTGGDARLEGAFAGLDEEGGLRLRLADGSIHVIRAGDVFLLEE